LNEPINLLDSVEDHFKGYYEKALKKPDMLLIKRGLDNGSDEYHGHHDRVANLFYVVESVCSLTVYMLDDDRINYAVVNKSTQP
jgi:hypothetical protein